MNSIKIKKIIIKLTEYYLVLLLILIFLAGNNFASYYGKGIGIHALPYDLYLWNMDAENYISTNETDMHFAIIAPDTPFSLNDSLHVASVQRLCYFKDFLAFQVRTKENNIKMITIWSKTNKKGIPLNEKYDYKIYDINDFYKNKQNFKYQYNYYVPCVDLRGIPGIVNMWGFIGWSILFLLTSWFILKVYNIKNLFKI